MTRFIRRRLQAAVQALLLTTWLSACDNTPVDGADPGPTASSTADTRAPRKPLTEDAEQQLVGTWLREHTEKGVGSRRLLRLEADGSFEEKVRLTNVDGQVSEHRHAGTWLFDGTNLKRKYTLMNGQPPSRLNLPFATFQIELPSRNELVGTNHIHKHRVQYRRVQPETEL